MPTFSDASGNGYDAQLTPVVTREAGPLQWGRTGPLPTLTAPTLMALGTLGRTAAMAAIPLNGPYSLEYWITLAPGLATWMNPVGWASADGYAFVASDFYADGAFTQDLEVYQQWPDQYGFLPYVVGQPGNGPEQDAQWHHVIVTNSGATGAAAYVFYLDGLSLEGITSGGVTTYGAALGLGPGTQGDITATITLGDGPNVGFSWGEPLDGGLAHVALYAAVLSADQVVAHYNAAGYRNLASSLPGTGTRTRDRAKTLSAALTPVGVRGRDYPHTVTATLTPTASRSHVLAPQAFTRGTFIQPQHAPRTLATPEGASPLRALPVGDTTATDAVLAPDDANLAYYLDWSNTLPAGFGIASISAQALMRPSTAVAWSAASDVTSPFIVATAQLDEQTRVIVADGSQTLGQQYRVRILATFSNSPATVLEAFFDLTVAET